MKNLIEMKKQFMGVFAHDTDPDSAYDFCLEWIDKAVESGKVSRYDRYALVSFAAALHDELWED